MWRIRSFLALERTHQALVVEGAICLAAAWIGVRALPFRWVAASLGRARAESSHDERPAQRPTLARVVWAIDRVSRGLPWTSTCLMQAMAAQWMLRRRGVPGTLYLGMARDEESGELLAHAWLRSGARVVTGGDGLSRRYTVVGSFAEDEPD